MSAGINGKSLPSRWRSGRDGQDAVHFAVELVAEHVGTGDAGLERVRVDDVAAIRIVERRGKDRGGTDGYELVSETAVEVDEEGLVLRESAVQGSAGGNE